jgi:hypothetical protein
MAPLQCDAETLPGVADVEMGRIGKGAAEQGGTHRRHLAARRSTCHRAECHLARFEISA